MNMGRKMSGGKYKRGQSKKKLRQRKGQARIVKLGEKKTKLIRCRGGALKLISLSHKIANVMHNGKAKKAEIKTVVETPSNRFLARQNVLVKGAKIETSLGKARITNRPSQEGIVNAVLIE
jgi:small subunit ribosomal protein S8e